MSRSMARNFHWLAILLALASAGAAGAAPSSAAKVHGARDWPIDRELERFSPAADAAWKRSPAQGGAFADSLLRLARARHDRSLEAAAHAWRGRKLANVYRIQEGAADLDTAWALAKSLRDSSGLARVIAARAHGATMIGRTDEARAGFLKLIPLARAAGLQALEGFAHRTLGYIDKNAGRYAAARGHLREAIRRIPADRFENLHSRFLLAEVENRMGRHDEARQQFLGLLDEARNRGEPFIVASCLNDLGNLEYEGGDMAKADGWWSYAASVFDSMGSAPSAGELADQPRARPAHPTTRARCSSACSATAPAWRIRRRASPPGARWRCSSSGSAASRRRRRSSAA